MEKGKASPRPTTGGVTGTAGTSPQSMGTQPGRAGTDMTGDTTMGATTARGTAGRSRTGNGHHESGVVDQMKDRAARELSSQKGRATGELDAVAQAVRDASHRLRDEHHESVATYVEGAAAGLERLSRTIREKDLNELLHDAQRLARRQPAWFIGGSFALGLLAARFLKSSGTHGDGDWADWPEGNRGPWADTGWETRPRSAGEYASRTDYPRGTY
jgi:hypothetical protein